MDCINIIFYDLICIPAPAVGLNGVICDVSGRGNFNGFSSVFSS